MTMQCLCHARIPMKVVATMCLCVSADVPAAPPMHDYPTLARVEYVNECMAKHGGKLAGLYQCACVIDRIAQRLNYDEFVEASTFAKYSALPGEGGGVFRDSQQAQAMAKLYRMTESDAYRACGLQS